RKTTSGTSDSTKKAGVTEQQGIVSSTVEQARDTVNPASETTWQTARDVGTRASDAAGQAYDYGRRAVRTVSEQADTSLITLFVGLGLGYALAYFIHAG